MEDTPAPAPAVEVRFAGPDDAPILCRMIHALAAFERDAHAVKTTPALIRDQLRAERPPFEALIADQGGESVGMAVYTQTYSTWTGRPSLYLEDLFVGPSSRSTGVGRALMIRLAQIALNRGCARMDWQVLDWNARAIGFYDRLGAAPQSGWIPWRFSATRLKQLAAQAPNIPR
ncbi:MAG: GNAT superfamily N-acetyltransferase [Bradymonadia bacterium]|jgi:GNAT superfamily N-acetyltransferase